MLEMRPNCECCGRDLAADSTDAMVCSFECTYCRDCAEGVLAGICPNCGGPLVARPSRSLALQARYPGSTKRVVKTGGCVIASTQPAQG